MSAVGYVDVLNDLRCACDAQALGTGRASRPDIVIDPEQIAGIVAIFQFDQPFVVRSVCRAHAVHALVPEIVDVDAASKKWLQRSKERA